MAALWQRFPKFVLGFLVASIVVTVYSQLAPAADAKVALDITKVLREWFLTAAFISIGLELKVGSLREAGWKPVAAFSAATVFNLLLGLALASLLFASVTV